ncbi:3-hydroxyacyl-CoA dehydrogenase/enoyl-CoA hydratase family protein [Marinicrinis lubricantis]|uniref:3-hydroxyacyl-CoA dehydrogenase NAD-binding domain-containing protein n=1 Tax=Marinicrinis lubricantis TaxID=2086470 RepID=A0ABW1IL94_9BACL
MSAVQIDRAAVIGAGVMGAAIAGHLAGAGIRCLLLDVVPHQLLPDEERKGLTISHSAVRNRLAEQGKQRLVRMNPAPLYDARFIHRIETGNVEDDWERLSEMDWIIEAVVERLDVKQQLLSRLEQVWKPGTIVSSNTSGVSIQEMSKSCSPSFRQHFMGTHFFNPPRYMKLLEIIPGDMTDSSLVQDMKQFCEKRLGKGVVIAKDTPNFIANRIGTYGLMMTVQEMVSHGYTIEEVDAVTGPALGRPKSATFRTLDLVGLDTFLHVAGNVRDRALDESERRAFDIPELLQKMVDQGWLGEKSGSGFYQKVKGASGSVIKTLDLQTMQYRERQHPVSSSLQAAKQAKGTASKIKALLGGSDKYSKLAWDVLKHVLVYAAEKLGEIADRIEDIDQSMKWGFNWELGPFEIWDAIGVEPSVRRMEQEGLKVPDWVKERLEAGTAAFYRELEGALQVAEGKGYRPLDTPPEWIHLPRLKRSGGVILGNSGASLLDIGDDVACLEFHSPNNAIGADILSMIQQSVDIVEKDYAGLVIANQGRNFCVGANIMLLLMEAQDEEWDEVDRIIRYFQDTMTKLKYCKRPVVAAPHRMTLGGGVEVCLPSDRTVFAAETYFGLVETGVGLIPAGGGCKEMLRRMSDLAGLEQDLTPQLQSLFETIAMAKVSSSGFDAANLGYARPTDRVVMQQERQIYEAKQSVLELNRAGYSQPYPAMIRVTGENGAALLKAAVQTMLRGGYISEHDALIASKLAAVLSGGAVGENTMVSEQHILDLEREAFLSLCGEPKTQQRMQHMLSKGKPLRN